MVCVDVKQHWSRGDRPEFPVPNSPYGLCGRNAAFTLTLEKTPEMKQLIGVRKTPHKDNTEDPSRLQ